jgi:Fic family protein
LKVPAPPPDTTELFQKLSDDGRLLEVLSQALPGSMTREYLPWDRLRYKTPPDGLSVEEWWVAVRLARQSMERPVELLRDQTGRPFSFALPDEVLQAIEEVNRDASGNISVSEQVTNPGTRDRYIVNSLIEEAITSSQLEGASTSRRVAKDMIRSGRLPTDRSERMILNNYMAMQRITELRDETLTPELICEIHRIVTEGTLDDPDGAGRIQADDETRVSVWGQGDQLLYRPPSVSELPGRMEALCQFANGEGNEGYMPAVLRAIAIHFMIGYDHYFEDGNGRTARALFYWSMLRQGFWLTEFLTISRILKKAPAQYARSFLFTEQDRNDLTHFFIYHLQVIRRSIRELHHYLAFKTEEIRAVQQSMKALPGEYNYRQLALLEHAIRNPGFTYSAQSHARSHNTSEETARQDLGGLERKELLHRYKVGKRFLWTPVDNLSETLKAG